MENNEMYARKQEVFQKALNRQEADYVPNALSNNGGSIFWTGKTILDVIHDPVAYAEALTAVLSELWIDVNIECSVNTTPRLGDAFPGAENRYASDGTLTHLQVPPMEKDEYDQLIDNPEAFIANVLLPRKHANLFQNRDTAKQALKVYAEENAYNAIQADGVIRKILEERYHVATVVTPSPTINTPLDHLFDFFRGFSGTLTDLRRQPKKVKAAMDAIWEYRWAEKIKKPGDFHGMWSFQPCHIPAYLSPKQFDELYWPYEKQLIEWINRSGTKAYIILEGRWEKIWHRFLELPKDSCVLHIDDDDFFKAYEALGQYQILCGGLKGADVCLKKFTDIKDDIKRLIDTCAPGGGFLFCSDKCWLTPGDVNQTMIDAYNFAHEYSRKA